VLLALAAVRGRSEIPPPAAPESPRSALSPEEALRTFRVPDGLRIELFAAEPDVTSPVAMAFDENGRVYVVEMNDYPLGQKTGRVKLLEDGDGRGHWKHVTVFVDHLSFPNGVMPFKGGVLVTSAPDLLYLKDTDGDGKADVRQVVFTGFAESNPQHRFNTPTYSVDNWIYGADGESPGGIRPGNQPDASPVPLRGSDFRFRSDFSHFELASGRSQYAMTFDDWGNRFVNHNSIHIRHTILPRHYLKRNPYLAVPEVIDEIANEGKPVKVYPASKLEPRFNDPWAAGYFTSACSVVVYRGDGLPAEYRGNAFVCEPVHNLVHRDLLVPHGVSFVAEPAYEGKEFLASTDNWSRPVNLTVGPDGALYVVDMYRAVIEHPQWIPLDIQKKIDLRAGADRGRIYRIVPKEGLKAVQPRLGTAGVAQLVSHLEHPNAWWRQTAQRLLVERQKKAAVEPLRKLARETKSSVARLHALWTLAGLDGLEDGLIEQALRDPEAGIREHALRLAEPRLAASAALREAVLQTAGDDNPRVRFQAAFTLGELHDPRALTALARIAARDASDRWVRTAVLSSVPESAAQLLAHLRSEHRAFLDRPGEGAVELVRQLAGAAGARRDAKEVPELLALVTADGSTDPSRWQLAALSGLGDSLQRAGVPLAKYLGDAKAAARLSAWTARALETAGAANRDIGERVDALTLLALLPAPSSVPQLQTLLRPQEPQRIQTAAVHALAAMSGKEGLAALLDDWDSRTATVRREILGLLTANPERVRLFLDAVEKGVIRPDELDAARRDQLTRFPDEGLRERARKLLGAGRASNRQKLLDEWGGRVLSLPGDGARGQKVYATHCATCHRLHGQGVAVGPDLASVSNRTREALLVDILDPNRAVDPVYLSYVVVTNNGQVFDGIIGTESANSVTLRRAERQEITVLRKDIAEIRSTNVSLMPEGFEKNLTPQDLADLLELLRKGQLFK
jgi:putative membrane-bound dehydrogenase-like protein